MDSQEENLEESTVMRYSDVSTVNIEKNSHPIVDPITPPEYAKEIVPKHAKMNMKTV